MTLHALIFDFDGLVIDTESPAFQAWQELFAEHGGELALTEWALALGGSGAEFDPWVRLDELAGGPVDRAALRDQRWRRKLELVAEQTVLPGVRELIVAARERGLCLAIASSASRAWVDEHLERCELAGAFDVLATGDEVDQVKPDPAVYQLALARLEVTAPEAAALEDSPNGVSAARAARIFVVAVPNALTRQLSLDHANMRLTSLAEESPMELLTRIERVMRVCSE